MTTKNTINITISLIALVLIMLIAFKYCSNAGNLYTKKHIDKILSEKAAEIAEYKDSLNFMRGQADLQYQANTAHIERIKDLEYSIDSLYAKHQKTKKRIRHVADMPPNADSGYAMLVPTEYIDECETCFNKLKNYKDENVQLRFERDSYDSLMRQQIKIQDDRVTALDFENTKLRIKAAQASLNNNCDTTRKLKLSAMGMFSEPFLPRGGGGGFIYEDKKFNEYGAHVLFTNRGPVYILNVAKTISLRRKK